VAEELHHLEQLGLRLLHAGHVLEGHRRLRIGLHLRRLDARHHLHRAPEQVADQAEEEEREPRERGHSDVAQQVPHVRHGASIGSRVEDLKCRL